MAFYNLRQAATQLNRSERTIRRMIQRGELRAERVSGPTGIELRINAQDVEELLEERGEVVDSGGHLAKTVGQVADTVGSLSDTVGHLSASLQTQGERLARIEGAVAGQWVTELTAQQQVVGEALKELTEEVKKLREENSALRERLERKPWWERWFRSSK